MLAGVPLQESVPSLRYRKVGDDRHDSTCWAIVERKPVMHEMMSGGMMWGMGFWAILLLVPALLAVAALIKYVFFR